MKRIWIQIFIVIIGLLLCMVSYNGVKKYVYKNFINKETKKQLVYNNTLSVSSNPYIVESNSEDNSEELTTTSTSKIITTTPTTITTTSTTTTMLTTTTQQIIEELEKEVINFGTIDDSEIILDGMTLDELTAKLNRSLNSTLFNTGYYFANYYKKTGLDPYLAIAIVLHETGCKWTCSKLVRECNNIGGMKGTPSCNGGSYKKFDTLEDGINGYLDMLFNNYYSKGLTTPELINPKYAASTTWSEKINNYMIEIKSK